MSAAVYTVSPKPRQVNEREVLRYAGARGADDGLAALLADCRREAEPILSNRVCYAESDLLATDGGLDLGFAVTDSASLCRHLDGCDRVIVFAATVGIALDRLIAKYGVTQPSKALMLEALGTERIEALCDAFEDSVRASLPAGRVLCPRFSPGYGDLPLALQTKLFPYLDCPRRIGLSLGAALLMSPSKSVSAIIGIKGVAK